MTCFELGFGRGGVPRKKEILKKTEKQKNNKEKKKLKKNGRPTLGWGKGEGSPMHRFFVFFVFVFAFFVFLFFVCFWFLWYLCFFCFFWQIADSRLLTSQ